MSGPTATAGRAVTRVLIGVLLACFGVAAAMGIVLLVLGDDSAFGGRVIGAALIGGAYVTLVLAAVTLIRRGESRWLMAAAIVLGTVAEMNWQALLWNGPRMTWQSQQQMAQLGVTITVFSFVLVYTGGVRALKTRATAFGVARWVVIAVAWSFAGMLTLLVWLGDYLDRTLAGFALGVLVITTVLLGSLCVLGPLVLRSLIASYDRRFARETRSMSGSIRVALTCPECGAELSVPAGPARCRDCGLTMNIEFEEPRCACGYLLYRLVGETCPECGRAVPEAERWPEAIPPAERNDPRPEVDRGS